MRRGRLGCGSEPLLNAPDLTRNGCGRNLADRLPALVVLRRIFPVGFLVARPAQGAYLAPQREQATAKVNAMMLARAEKDYAKADAIRDELKGMGVWLRFDGKNAVCFGFEYGSKGWIEEHPDEYWWKE